MRRLGKTDEGVYRVRIRRKFADLRTEMAMDAGQTQFWSIERRTHGVDRLRVRKREAELRRGSRRLDQFVRVRCDRRIEPQQHVDASPGVSRDVGERRDLALVVDDDVAHAMTDGGCELVARLVAAVENAPVRGNAAAKRGLELAERA